jgi:hypothetical protein
VRAELFSRGRRRHGEERVESRRAGHDDTIARDAVVVHRFARLVLIPDEDAIRGDADETAVGQVVPAEWHESDRHPEAVRALHVVRLIRPEVDQRRDEHDIRCMGANEQFVIALARNERLGGLQRATHERQAVLPSGVAGEPIRPSGRRVLARAGGELGRIGMARFEEAEVIARLPQRPDERLPFVDAADRVGDDVETCVGGEFRELERLVAFVCGRDDNGMPATGQLIENAGEMAGLAEVVDEEKDAQDRPVLGRRSAPQAHATWLTDSAQISYYLPVTTRVTSSIRHNAIPLPGLRVGLRCSVSTMVAMDVARAVAFRDG